MTKREFNLPGIQDLSKGQEEARSLAKEGQHLIIGGPGTGKSVVALLRARRHQRDKDDYVFLVYNKLLNQASGQLFGAGLCSQQWQSWFKGIFNAATGENVPMLPAEPPGTWQEFDWSKVSEVIAASSSHNKLKHPFLIIDEGQDMPPEFYQALVKLGFENFYVVADQNQQIISGLNSTRLGIQNALGIAPGDVIELHENYRNPLPIARLAREFYTGDPASPLPSLPDKPSRIRSQLIAYEDFQKLIENILKLADSNPAKLIGIITPNNKARERYVNELRSVTVQLDNGRPAIQTYASGANARLSFNEGGIMVINAQACKGLEFDIVFLADIDQHYYNAQDQEEPKATVLVALGLLPKKP